MALERFRKKKLRPIGKLNNVLYVEDDDVNWAVAELALTGKYVLTRAASARETFELLAENKYDVILMDIELAGSDLSGIEITKILRGLTPLYRPPYTHGVTAETTPIIFVTAYTTRYSKADLCKVGGDDLISKPVNFTALAFGISRLLMKKVRGTTGPAGVLADASSVDSAEC